MNCPGNPCSAEIISASARRQSGRAGEGRHGTRQREPFGINNDASFAMRFACPPRIVSCLRARLGARLLRHWLSPNLSVVFVLVLDERRHMQLAPCAFGTSVNTTSNGSSVTHSAVDSSPCNASRTRHLYRRIVLAAKPLLVRGLLYDWSLEHL